MLGPVLTTKDPRSPQKVSIGPKLPHAAEVSRHRRGQFQPTQKQKTPEKEHKGLFSGWVVFRA
jgi:hypothetical protein